MDVFLKMRLVLLVFFLTKVSSFNNSNWQETIRNRRQSDSQVKKCILPPHPANGVYSIAGKADAKPGEQFDAAQVHVSCNPGYRPLGNAIVYCVFGDWSHSMPKCVRHCRLDPHPSVKYRCQVTNDDTEETSYRDCLDYEPAGTIVRPQCNEPNYYFTGLLSHMRCLEGRWNYIAVCQPQCGTVTTNGKPLILEGRVTRRGEFPWHAGIYRKDINPFKLICGGSLVSNTVVISAAHCFWMRYEYKVRPASSFAVALGKVHREWSNPLDTEAQTFDVADVKIPAHYQDAQANFQVDIAVVWLSAPAVYRPHIRPVCLDFDLEFDAHQLQEGNLGKVAGWGIEDLNGTPSPLLKVLELPYVSVERCIKEAPMNFKQYITSDKICAGYTNGSAVCQGDSGGGLVFPGQIFVSTRYYLRGIVSTAPESEFSCNGHDRTTFTRITKHKDFIEKYTVSFGQPAVIQQEPESQCILPPYPQHGSYSVLGLPAAQPGQSFPNVQLTVRCNPGYTLKKKKAEILCTFGRWSEGIPECIEDCGRVTQESLRLKRVAGGHPAQPGEMPWIVGVYRKTTTPYQQICSGSIVRTTIILTAAHCFWDDDKKLLPARDYAVAAGKLYKSWGSQHDQYTQKSDIREIKITSRFQGSQANFQDDIALMKLVTEMKYNQFVSPVCVNFDYSLYSKQLKPGNIGKFAGWGLTGEEDSTPSNILNVAELPYIDIEECIVISPAGFRKLITSDKICAGYINGTAALCRGDTGAGLVFPEFEDGADRFYVRGIASVAQINDKRCNIYTFTAFTDINRHEQFIKSIIGD